MTFSPIFVASIATYLSCRLAIALFSEAGHSHGMDIIALLSDPAAWLALLTLIALEVVLGIDNLIFIAILSNKLPEHQQPRQVPWSRPRSSRP